ncbi:peptidyl-prolyl cis-trans isomerase [Ottowia sp. GY511]|uniref:Peptidyl-prolyl cis-trans isomerase n=1 Tax=Ottowia flava TaxID=2675430 RepID=A0ABW4KQ66_9BURK|nr:peptidylprolyl isomerase [Ottowia sp. GY511]TXK32967.1 peptidyl-prolyl cis-trans isomerase [Ottowia sp. GY511]
MKKVLNAVFGHTRFVLAGVVLSVCAVHAVAETPPLATLANGETITEADFGAYLNRRVDLKPLVRNFWGAENALREMVMTRMLVLEGQRIKVPVRSSEKAERFDDIYAHAVYQQLAETCVKPSDEVAARRFYDKNPEAFTAPASARLARVMLPASEKVAGSSAMGWLMDQAQEVVKSAKSFEQVAQDAEKIYKMEVQGDLGWVNLTGDLAIMRALAGAKKGEIVGPVRDGDFAYLFLIGDVRPSYLMKWDDVKTSAANRQLSFCREKANKSLSEKLTKQYGAAINTDAIKALFKIPPSRTPASASPPANSPAKNSKFDGKGKSGSIASAVSNRLDQAGHHL